jgi:hypothetical protein
MAVTVGTTQVATKRSDHVPIIVDMPSPSSLSTTVVAAP